MIPCWAIRGPGTHGPLCSHAVRHHSAPPRIGVAPPPRRATQLPGHAGPAIHPAGACVARHASCCCHHSPFICVWVPSGRAAGCVRGARRVSRCCMSAAALEAGVQPAGRRMRRGPARRRLSGKPTAIAGASQAFAGAARRVLELRRGRASETYVHTHPRSRPALRRPSSWCPRCTSS